MRIKLLLLTAIFWSVAALSIAARPVAARPNTAAIRDISIDYPSRSFGYFIGDTLTHTVTLTLNRPYRLKPDSLPQAGRVNHWLQRYPAVVTEEQCADSSLRYVIDLTYQIININAIAQTISTPEQQLLLSDGQGSFSAVIPAWQLRLNSLTDPVQPASHLRDDHLPRPLAGIGGVLWLAGSGLVVALSGLAYLHLTIPFSRRHNRPFAQACKKLRKHPHLYDNNDYQQALRTVHQAFNITLGETVFAGNLDRFFDQCPGFQRLRSPIEHYFAHSQRVFFDPQDDSLKTGYTITALLGLCRQCRDLERGLS